MHRRHFMFQTAATLAVTSLAIAGCGTTTTSTVTPGSTSRRTETDTAIDAVLTRLYSTVPGSRELVLKANGVLVFPNVIAAGFVVGGQYGEGALRVHSKTVDYYNVASVSAGFLIGAQSTAMFFLFLTQDALDQFRKSEGWSVGVDASVALVKVGATGNIDVNSVTGPVVAFVLTNTGLMANLSLEGTKITRLTS